MSHRHESSFEWLILWRQIGQREPLFYRRWLRRKYFQIFLVAFLFSRHRLRYLCLQVLPSKIKSVMSRVPIVWDLLVFDLQWDQIVQPYSSFWLPSLDQLRHLSLRHHHHLPQVLVIQIVQLDFSFYHR